MITISKKKKKKVSAVKGQGLLGEYNLLIFPFFNNQTLLVVAVFSFQSYLETEVSHINTVQINI